MKYKIYLRYQKVSKNTMVPFIDIYLGDILIASAEVSTYKSTSAKSIPVNSSLNTQIKLKKQLDYALGDYSLKSNFIPVKVNYRHDDWNLYYGYKTAMQLLSDPDYSYDKEYYKNEIKEFLLAYPEFRISEIKKRHLLKKRMRDLFNHRKIQAVSNEEIQKGIEYFKNLQ
ncbi:hypothetical protein [Chryseobacterium sp.]|uniref:hypothetical protein n=1 Tax=Chryseobacterium sp. TaxID=1871047 RepID=UPI00321AA374